MLCALGARQISFAQTPEIDSLLTVVRTAKEDTNKVNALNLLSQEIGWTVGNYDTASYYAEAAKLLAESLHFKKGMAVSYNNIGIIYHSQGNYSEALRNQFASLKNYEDIGSERGMARSYNNIGVIYENQGNYPEALKNHFSSLKILEEIGDKDGLSASYNNVGNIYGFQGDYPEALKNYSASLKIEEEIGDKSGMADSYNNIGSIYGIQGNYPEALKNQLASLRIQEEVGDKYGIAVAYSNIGITHYMQGNYPETLKNLLAALKIHEEIGNKHEMANAYNNISELYIELNDKDAARKYLSKGLKLSKEIGAKGITRSSYRLLSQLDSIQGDYKSAYNNYKLFILYRDSLLNEENTKKITQLEMQYEFDKKEAIAKAEQDEKDAIALKELQKQKLVRNGFVGGFAVMVLFAGIFLAQRNKIRKGKKQSDELLLNILPEEVAEELKAKGHADARHFDEVTVLFTDFKGFTKFSENLSPKDLVGEIDVCFKAFDHIMEKHGIEKIKTIGDAYMAAGGLPVVNRTNASDVVRAGIEIRDFIRNRRAEKGEESFEIRIGIHTGPVVAGIVGIKKFAYDIWGDTVNTASRMESSGEAGKVNISETTYQLVKDQFACAHRGEIEAKGKGKVKMYFVENA